MNVRPTFCLLSMLLAATAMVRGTVALGGVGPSELWTINVDGAGLARLADTSGYTCGSPEWSPDGTHVAFGAWRADQDLRDAHIFVIGVDGTGRRDLGPGAMPNWSPDGKLLVFHEYGRGPNSGDRIVVMNADGSGRETILNHWGSPRWPRRRQCIVSILNYNNLAVFDLATGVERTILPRAYPIYLGFGVSADGRRFCFSGASRGLYLATLEGESEQASVRQLVAAGRCQYASFSPDGKRVAFSWTRPGVGGLQLYIMDVDGNAEPQRLEGQDETRVNWAPNWSPDGKRIIFGSKAVTP